MKFKEQDIILKCGADMFLPFALVFGLYVILFGSVSSGGGFQGGVIVTSAFLLVYRRRFPDVTVSRERLK